MPLSAGQTLTHYEILGPLGAGGMGEVYRARDTRLEREVAIKVLPEALRDDPERRARFLREARAVAQLGHPNIAQILDVGEAEGHDFIAFELVEGATLSDRIAGRPLGVEEIATLALPLADALGYAHERGILHRDLKAGNVMLSSRGHPKLLDFGLAKVLQDGAGARKQSTTLTMQGAIFGTPGAMSPEQALGRTVDQRSDVFSFGSLLYEMACGRPAFGGGTVMEIMDAVIHREPAPLARARPELPPDFVAIVEKALRKEPSERYQSMADLAADLRHFKRKTDSGLVPPARGERRVAPRLAATGLALAAIAAASAWFLRREPAPPTPPAEGPGHIAVLYFENKADPSDADQLGDLLAHLVTTELTRDPSLSVLSQQRLFETARRLGREDGKIDAATASAVATAAGVSSMVVGRVAQAGSQLLASASVVDAGSGRELAAGQARGKSAADVFDMAEELGRGLRDALGTPGRTKVSAPGTAERVTTSVEAYREFLGGFNAMQLLRFDEANEHFARATTLDPAFAQAWYWDAIASAWEGNGARQVRSIERASAFSERLPPDELRTLPAADLFHHGRYIDARPVLERLVAEDPRNRDSWYMLGEVYVHSPADADAERAANAFQKVLAIDPLFSMVGSHVAYALFCAGEREKAMEWNERLRQDGDPELAPLGLALAMWNEDPKATAAAAAVPVANVSPVLVEYRNLVALGAALARDDDADPSVPWARDLLTDPEAKLRSMSRALRFPLVGSLHQMCVLEGAFDEARALSALLPPASDFAGLNNFPAGMLSSAHLLGAYRLALNGKVDEALAAVDDVCAAIDAPRASWQAVVLCLQLGREEEARQHVAALEKLAARGTRRTGYYLELARAELDLAAGRADDARAVFEHALAPDRVLGDAFASVVPVIGAVMAGLLRAQRALGDDEALTATLRRIVERPMLRAWDPITWRRAQAELGIRELAAGDDAGRARLEDFLAAWGKEGRDLPEVVRARAALDAARSR